MTIYRLFIDFPSSGEMLNYVEDQDKPPLPSHHPNEGNKLVPHHSIRDRTYEGSLFRFCESIRESLILHGSL